jgi:integrase
MTAKTNVKKLGATTVNEVLSAKTYKKHKPRAKTINIRCTELKGFYIRILPSGNKTYMVNARLGGSGKQKYPKIGDCERTPFAEAKDKARDYLYKLSQGIDPLQQEKKDESLKLTLGKAFADYIELMEGTLAPKTIYDYELRIRQNLAPLRNKAVGEITVQDVKDWWKKSEKKRGDDLALQYASVVMDEFVSDEAIEKNPFRFAKLSNSIKKTIKPLGETDQHIPMKNIEDYVSAMFNVWDRLESSMRDLVLFVLLTGKRINESSKIKWEDVDFDEGVIKIQKQNTKKKVADHVPMTPYLLCLLNKRQNNPIENWKKEYAGNPYVFWSMRKKMVHCKDPKKTLKNIWEAVENKFKLQRGEYITSHDLRRTIATASDELGFKLQDVSSILAHKKKNVTQRYIRRSNETNRKKLEQAQQYLNRQSNDGILLLLAKYYGAPDIGFPAPEEDRKISYREEMSHWIEN